MHQEDGMHGAHWTPNSEGRTPLTPPLEHVSPASTPDEHLVVAYLIACVYGWQLQRRELAAVAQALEAPEPLSLEQALLAETRLDRCLTLVQTMQEASGLLHRYIIAAAPHISVGFSLQGTVAAFPLYEDAHAATNRVQRFFLRTGSGLPALRSRIMDYATRAGEVRRTVMRLVATLSDPELPPVTSEALLPAALLTRSAQAKGDMETPEQTTLENVAQLFHVWGELPTSALITAASYLRYDPPAVLETLGLVHRAADLVRFWHRLIDILPLESLSLARLPTISYQQALGFYEALVQVLVERNILTPGAAPTRQAQQIASILLPGSAKHPQADVAALCRAALLLDDRLALWHQHVLALRSLTGERDTTHERLFPLLHEALEVVALGQVSALRKGKEE